MKKSTKLRLVGFVVLLFNLWLIGRYNIKGIPVLLLTLGFAAGFEYLLVRPASKMKRFPNPPPTDAPREEGERWVNDTTSPPANSKKDSNVWSEELLRKYGIITILVGVGILFISIFFSSGYHPSKKFIGNISRMEIVIKERYYTSKKIDAFLDGDITWDDIPKRVAIPKVAIPLKYPLSLSVIFILLGTGVILISKNKKPNA